jgi:hypothetical protein
MIDRLNNETFDNFVSIKRLKTDDRLTEVLLDPTFEGAIKYSFNDKET